MKKTKQALLQAVGIANNLVGMGQALRTTELENIQLESKSRIQGEIIKGLRHDADSLGVRYQNVKDEKDSMLSSLHLRLGSLKATKTSQHHWLRKLINGRRDPSAPDPDIRKINVILKGSDVNDGEIQPKK